MNIELYQWQLDALNRMHNGCVLYGKVGCGKSRTAIAYTYLFELGGSLRINNVGVYTKPEITKDIFIITTAKKRDTLEWEQEVAYFGLENYVNVYIDSWNKIKMYRNIYGAMFIFDEQKAIGSGVWAKSFMRIARRNHWILLSATPGDNWKDYIPVMVANGYYKNPTDFKSQHCIYKPYLDYPVIDHYIGTKKLERIAEEILVKIDYENTAVRHVNEVKCEYDKMLYKKVWKDRWDVYEDCPIENPSKLCYVLRKICNSDSSRFKALSEIIQNKNKVIIFYNFTYELHDLREFFLVNGFKIGECNGECHTEIPTGDKWAYLVQYMSGAEGWNCTKTDTIIFFSQNHSYKIVEQATGRIDRANTPFTDLYYYHLRSSAPIDIMIKRCLDQKQVFNDRMLVKGDKHFVKNN